MRAVPDLARVSLHWHFDYAAFASYTHIIHDQACSAPDTILTPRHPPSLWIWEEERDRREISKMKAARVKHMAFCVSCHATIQRFARSPHSAQKSSYCRAHIHRNQVFLLAVSCHQTINTTQRRIYIGGTGKIHCSLRQGTDDSLRVCAILGATRLLQDIHKDGLLVPSKHAEIKLAGYSI